MATFVEFALKSVGIDSAQETKVSCSTDLEILVGPPE